MPPGATPIKCISTEVMNSESTPATQLNQPEEPRQDPVLKSKSPITSFSGTPGWVKQLHRFPKRAEERNPKLPVSESHYQ